MIAGLRSYPVYKDSGVPWLGSVPEHWEVLPNRTTFSEVNNREHPQEQMLSVTIAEGVIRQKELLEDSSKKDSSRLDKTAYKLVEPGDVAYNKMRAWQGAVGVSKYRGIISPAYVVQRPRNGAYSRYLHYLLRTPAFAKEAERWSYGITSDMWSLRPEHFKMIYGCLPPLPEQTAIVRFLDHADRRIRRYIRAKQKLIALLEEQKQAIIHQAVTGQIDVRTGQPYPVYKPSGVEWLGDVPAHWEALRLATICNKITNGYVGPTRDVLVSEGIRYLQSLHIKKNQIQFDGKYFVEDSWSRVHAKSILMEGDVLVVQTGDIGQVAVVPKEFEGSNCHALIILSCRPNRAVGQFISLVLNSSYGFRSLNRIKTGALHPHLNCTFVREIRVPLPPLGEQHTIAAYLDCEMRRVDVLLEKTKKSIDSLHEYHTRLIADVVTGKLDVREAAAALPEVDPLAVEDSLADPLATAAESDIDELNATLEEVEA